MPGTRLASRRGNGNGGLGGGAMIYRKQNPRRDHDLRWIHTNGKNTGNKNRIK